MEEYEEYVNEQTLIKDSVFESLPKDLILCKKCQNLMKEPVLCINCMKYYCKKCIDEWKSRDQTCPNNCQNPIFRDIIENDRLINSLNFRCTKGCGAILSIKEMKKHYSSNCLEKRAKIRVMSMDQVTNYKNKNGNIEYLNSKQ